MAMETPQYGCWSAEVLALMSIRPLMLENFMGPNAPFSAGVSTRIWWLNPILKPTTTNQPKWVLNHVWFESPKSGFSLTHQSPLGYILTCLNSQVTSIEIINMGLAATAHLGLVTKTMGNPAGLEAIFADTKSQISQMGGFWWKIHSRHQRLQYYHGLILHDLEVLLWLRKSQYISIIVPLYHCIPQYVTILPPLYYHYITFVHIIHHYTMIMSKGYTSWYAWHSFWDFGSFHDQ